MGSAGSREPHLGSVSVVMGVPVDDVTVEEAAARIEELVELGRSTGRTHQVATVNVDFVVQAAGDPAVLDVLQRADLSIPDGMPVVWASRLLRTPIRTRASGVDLLPLLAERSAASGHRLVLFGAAPGVADQAAQVLREQHRGADVVAIPGPAVAGDGTMEQEAATLELLRAARPDVLGVALGNPKQERWIARYGAAVGAPVAIGIGGTLDFLTGVTTRAPRWAQAAGLEWLHRAMSEPRRLAGRYARDLVVFGPGVGRQLVVGRRRGAAVLPDVAVGPDGVTVRVLGPVPVGALEPALADALGAGLPLTIDLAGLDRLDNVTASLLAELVRRRADGPWQVVGVTPAVREAARRLGVGALLGVESDAVC